MMILRKQSEKCQKNPNTALRILKVSAIENVAATAH